MIHCKELNKSFDSKAEMFKALRENHEAIIDAKKAQVFKSCEKGIGLTAKPINHNKITEEFKGVERFKNDDYYYIAVNSTKLLDSHGDIHLNGIWSKTIKDQQGKNYLVADHKLELDKTIVKKEYVEMFTTIVPWWVVGKSYEGDTQILVYKVKKDKVINKVAKEWLESGDAIEASVRMQYINILFAVNSEAKEDAKFKANFDKYYPEIANKEEIESEIMYFWAVKEAKNKYESSLVLFGSNDGTGQVSIESSQPLKNTDEQNNEPSIADTQKKFYESLLKN